MCKVAQRRTATFPAPPNVRPPPKPNEKNPKPPAKGTRARRVASIREMFSKAGNFSRLGDRAKLEPPMSIFFRAMYRFGFTPWDSGVTPPELKELIEGPQARTPAKALDLGCGTGTNALYMTQHGWDVTAIA